ncbi:unnamed protein product [Choristocarpus tenellus]
MVSLRWWNIVQERYREPVRYYHTLDHIADMLEGSKEFELSRPELVQLAIFFHDLIYDPTSSTNEEDSACVFENFSVEAALEPGDVSTVTSYIIATKSHSVSDSDDNDLQAFIDLDMAVLGGQRGGYMGYAEKIRSEYAHVPHSVYCEKRAKVLEDFLGVNSIYVTGRFKQDLESTARANLSAEIHLLRRGLIPGHSTETEICNS